MSSFFIFLNTNNTDIFINISSFPNSPHHSVLKHLSYFIYITVLVQKSFEFVTSY